MPVPGIASAASVKSIRDFVPREEIQAMLQVGTERHVTLDVLLVERIRKTTGVHAITSAIEKQDGFVVPLKTMMESSKVHKDRFVQRIGEPAVREHDVIAFLVLEGNNATNFVHGGEAFPLETGTLVTFAGNVEHNTNVLFGRVKIAGPFHVRSMERVGHGGYHCWIDDPSECEEDLEAGFHCEACTNEGERCYPFKQEYGCLEIVGLCYFNSRDCQGWYDFFATTKSECLRSTLYSWIELADPHADLFTNDTPETVGKCFSTANGASGDPHIKLWTGVKYDYHGQCDLVLGKKTCSSVFHEYLFLFHVLICCISFFIHTVSNVEFEHGMDLRIHVRTELRGFYSFISAVAIQIGGEVLEITKDGSYYVNGHARKIDAADEKTDGRQELDFISGFSLHHKMMSHKRTHFYYIILGDREEIMIKSSKEFMAVKVDFPSKKHFADSVGLMGSFEDGSMLARDGITILHDPNDFGQEWQVLESEPMLFLTARAPQNPQKCILPPPISKERRLAQSKVSLDVAYEACDGSGDDLDSCVFDVLATGDVGMADANIW